mmetsp:Transcript_476/g.704  ORF Transcript_476/g.704 Transcript_476/m.704 type:complete len:862 (-) Transcript_476:50-2635(-)|eukprot:CAMPEP_0194215950 /NCGR_PEP_ID=MMETSP0156-20130528/18087_1 /TAXON_ID=33649 /ORGANISM="Thalassionema nitzschioides, Strain L26-B" /LENGTH=861 /DNA_ID=CAMNT_0038944599 /DNA_START=230 /DNA_END=2815 /DNA_ORIENTATION=-
MSKSSESDEIFKSIDPKVPLNDYPSTKTHYSKQSAESTTTLENIINKPLEVCKDFQETDKALCQNAAGTFSNYPILENKLDVIDGGASGQFNRLVRGWETIISSRLGASSNAESGTKQDTQVDNDEKALSAPVVLLHTHSSPLNYSSRFDSDDEEEIPPPQPGPVTMKRSSSTPMVERSAGSAFGTILRTMPHLTGSDDRSAFSLPMQRKSDACTQPLFSAFDPVIFSTEKTDVEKTSIEVTDMSTENLQQRNTSLHRWQRASKARNFIIDNVRVLSRRRHRSGRENPARPASTSSSSSGINTSSKIGEDLRNRCSAISARQKDGVSPPTLKVSIEVNVEEDCIGDDPKENSQERINFLDSTEKEVKNTCLPSSEVHGKHCLYQQLGSDLDEDSCRHSAAHTQASQANRLTSAESPQPRLIGNTLSQDSGVDSPGTAMSALTLNTSGQSTLATNTSATTNSDKITTLSNVSETDREVMETNKAGRDLRLRSPKRHVKKELDGDATVNSSSTGSTTTHGYLSLVGSPVTIRDGASMPTDQFFKGTQIPVVHSASSNSGSSSSGDSGQVTERVVPAGTQGTTVERVESQLTYSTVHPFEAVDTSSNTSISNLTKNHEPPVFVSYLHQQNATETEKATSKDNYRSTPPIMIETVHEEAPQEGQSPFGVADSSSNTTSSGSTQSHDPPVFVSYLHRQYSNETERAMEVVFEAAKPQSSRKIFRPVRRFQRDRRISERPPLSPCKGLRTQTTPPPSQIPSPIHQQQSPPNIVNHRMQNSRLSKPYVLRSSLQQNRVALISPDRQSSNKSKGNSIPEGSVCGSCNLSTSNVTRGQAYQETSVEVDKLGVVSNPANVVTPEKEASATD